MVPMRTLLDHRPIGFLPVLDAASLRRRAQQQGWSDGSWCFHSGLTGGEKYRVVVQYSGREDFASATLYEPREIYDFRRPYSLENSDFFKTLLTCCGTVRSRSTPFRLVLEVRPDQMGFDVPQTVERLTGQKGERNAPGGYNQIFQFNIELGGTKENRAVGTIKADHPGGTDESWYNPWHRSVIIVEFTSLSGHALLDSLSAFVWRLEPRFSQSRLDEPWKMCELGRLTSAMSLHLRGGDQLFVTDEGFELVNQPPPYWLRLPKRRAFDVDRGKWRAKGGLNADSAFTLWHVTYGRDDQASIVGIWV